MSKYHIEVSITEGSTELGTMVSVLPFSKLNKIIFGYFDPENIFLDNENN